MATNYFRADGWVKSANGQAIAGAQIYVCSPQPANIGTVPPSPLATIYSDPLGADPITQPIIADGFGHYDFYALPMLYTLVIVNTGIEQVYYPDQSLGGVGTSGSGTSLVLENNGVANGNQLLLNLVAGSNISIEDDEAGDITISSSGASLDGEGSFFVGPGITNLSSIYISDTINTGTFNTSANAVQVYLFELEVEFTVSKVSITSLGNSFSVHANFGIYSFAGNKLVDSGPFVELTGSGVQTKTLSSPVTLSPGTYWLAQATDTNTSGSWPAVVITQTTMPAMLSKNSTRSALAANSMSGGVLPSTLGTLTPFTPSSTNADCIFCPLFE
jgi:hypothetical protein